MNTSKLDSYLVNHKSVYISITGLKVKSIWKFLFFLRHAVASKIQADKAPGVLFVGVKKINGIEHTLTAWESKEAMQKYIYSGAHQHAIRAFRKIATGKTFGYEAGALPRWEDVHQLWVEKAMAY